MFVSSKKIVLLFALTALTTGCLEKAQNNTVAENTAQQQIAHKSWQWNDQRKEWDYNSSFLSRKPVEPPPSVWRNQDDAILLQVESPKELTTFDNAPNAVQMKVFQLSDSKAFLQAAQSAGGLKNLLVTEQIDPSVLAMQRLMVLPGVSQAVNIDRKAGTRYIGVVMGYASLEQNKIFRLIPLVSVANENAESVSKLSALLPAAVASEKQPVNEAVSKEAVRAAVLKLNLQLKTDGIDKLDVDAL